MPDNQEYTQTTEATLSQNQPHTPPFPGVLETASHKSIFTIGFSLLVVFAFLRPLSLTFSEVSVFTLSVFEIFGIGFSYILFIPALLNFRNLRLDRTTLIAILFCLYCAQSMLWGSDAAFVARITLPFIIFFAVRIFITVPKQIGVILIAIVAGYIIPITTSTYKIIFARSVEFVNIWTGMERFEGTFGGSHVLAYAMLIFSFIYCLLNRTGQLSGKLSKSALLVFHLFAIFCLYKSYTRTAMIGLIIFWSIYLWGTNKKRLLLLVIACGLVVIVASQRLETIFWNTSKNQHDLNSASSGRLTIWHHNLQLFLDSTIPQQLLGRGLGSESHIVFGAESEPWPAHNDYLSLLMTLGVIGLFIYLSLLASLLWDIYSCGLDKSTECLFGGILVSFITMTFLSNALVLRVENSQYFWLLMGFFYRTREMVEDG